MQRFMILSDILQKVQLTRWRTKGRLFLLEVEKKENVLEVQDINDVMVDVMNEAAWSSKNYAPIKRKRNRNRIVDVWYVL